MKAKVTKKQKTDIKCDKCGAEMEYREGVSKRGQKYAGTFCTKCANVYWGKLSLEEKEK